ncbi:MAG: hypothetical protein ACOCWI_03970 [Bacillota bacterium]
MAKNIKRYYGIQKRKKIINMIIAGLLIISVLVVLITVYGQNVGNFVIGIETNVRQSMSLSETADFAKPTTRLSAPGIREQTHATLQDIPQNIEQGDGAKNEYEKRRYFAYSFYVKNVSSIILDYDIELQLNKSTKGAESAVRIMIIRNGERKIYAKAKEYPLEEAGEPEDHVGTDINEPYMTIPFLSLTTIMRETETDFAPEAVNKYTVVMWLEGWDHECTDDIKGGIVRMEMNFKASY